MKMISFKTLKKVVLSLSLFLAFAINASAQGSKPHYVVSNPDKPADTQVYYDMLKDFDFAPYRFYNKRRVITFLKSNVTVELYSEKELHDLYQKPVHPLTIMDDVAKTDIAFIVNGGKAQLVTLKH